MEENYIESLLKKPIWVSFLISWLFYLVGLFLFSQMVWDTNIYQSDFTGNDFNTALSGYRSVDMVRYALSPVWILVVAIVIWALLKFGMTISETQIEASLLFKVILLGLFFISLPYWVKSVWFVLITSGYTPDEIKHFFPGSIIPLLDISEMSESKIKALSNINLYHLGFILFSAWAITKNSVLSYFESLMLVLLTYGTLIALINFFRVFFFG